MSKAPLLKWNRYLIQYSWLMNRPWYRNLLSLHRICCRRTRVMRTCKIHPDIPLNCSDWRRLDAYYVFIHLYYPILPPPERLPVCNRPLSERSPFRPSSPLSLAISAILALIPHPEVKQPSRSEYVKLRRDLAHSFAQSALEAVETDLELLDSSVDPSKALSDGAPQYQRKEFHSKVPVCLEAVLALVVLSVYEYAQRGNINKMCNRAGQALTAAMSMSLHEMVDEDEYSEARRRAWWITVSIS